MKQPCSTCGFRQNPADSVFCVCCGNKVGDADNTSSFGDAGYSSSAPRGYQAQRSPIQTMAAFSSTPVQMGSTFRGAANYTTPHAFAGRGSRITHHAWLLYSQHVNAEKLRSAIMEILHLRKFQPLKLSAEKLRESGHWTEERDYITMQRGVTTIFVYVAPAGHDLYISRATTVQLSIDPIRIVFLICALADVFLGPSMIISLLAGIQSQGSVQGIQAPITILVSIIALPFIPSIILLFVFLAASIKHWVAERDFWIYLRRNYLHDFEIDDIKLLEEATDEAVSAAVKQLNLDATKIVPPAQGYQTRRRVRVI